MSKRRISRRAAMGAVFGSAAALLARDGQALPPTAPIGDYAGELRHGGHHFALTLHLVEETPGTAIQSFATLHVRLHQGVEHTFQTPVKVDRLAVIRNYRVDGDFRSGDELFNLHLVGLTERNGALFRGHGQFTVALPDEDGEPQRLAGAGEFHLRRQ